MTYLQGGDSLVQATLSHWLGQTFRPDHDFELQWIDLNLAMPAKYPTPIVLLFHAGADHKPWGDYLSRDQQWLLDHSFTPSEWNWHEPWGNTLSENNAWYPYPDPPSPEITIKNSIITLTNPGNQDCGISTIPLHETPPLLKAGKHLTTQFNNPSVTQNSTSSQLLIELILRHPGPEFFAIYLAIGLGAEFEHLKPQWTGFVAGRYYGVYYTGPGQKIQDIYNLFVKFRTELGQSTDPTDWELNTIAFALGTQSPSCIDYIKNDFIGFYYPSTPLAPPNPPAVGYTWPGRLARIRVKMAHTQLIRDEYYAIVLLPSSVFPANEPKWQYDKDDATYPAGVRIFSPDSGVTWQVFTNDDHLFAVLGTPTCPVPPPEPPVLNWAILDIYQFLTTNGYIIIAITNTPCHLYLIWSPYEPQKHPRTIISRGLSMPTAVAYCFVVWAENEQEEPGDTLIHTFTKEPWAGCETRWFTFRALVNNEYSPSVGPIFTKHRPKGLIFAEQFTLIRWPLIGPPFQDAFNLLTYPPSLAIIFTEHFSW